MAKEATQKVGPQGPSSDKVDPPQGLAVVTAAPSFLANKEIVGLSSMTQYQVVPRLKIVQKGSQKLLETFKQQDVIVMPSQGLVCPAGEVFYFTPIYFFVNWAILNDLKLKGREPMYARITSDPNDPIVELSRDKNRREIDHPVHKGMKQKHVEILNFLIRLHDHPMGDMPMTLSFERSEHFTGSKFATLIRSRGASPFACVFQARVKRRNNTMGDWEGFEIGNPEDPAVSPWVTEDRFLKFENEFRTYEKIYNSQGLVADTAGESADDEPAPNVGTGAEAKF